MRTWGSANCQGSEQLLEEKFRLYWSLPEEFTLKGGVMMRLTEEFIKNIGQDVIQHSEFSHLDEYRFDEKKKYDLFISHSFQDRSLVFGLTRLFTDTGYNVYVDWIDDKNLNRDDVTVETASLLRNRISNSKGLAYVATDNIAGSKWCPWELGIADGMGKKTCILPIMKKGYAGREYLNLYPYLEYLQYKGKTQFEFWITDQAKKANYTSLKKWLAGGQLLEHK